MKSMILATAALLIITVFVLFCSIRVSDIADELYEGLRSIESTTDSADEYFALRTEFLSKRSFLGFTVSHEVILSIENGFDEILGAIEANDEGALIIAKSRLCGLLSHLRRLSGINFESIF